MSKSKIEWCDATWNPITGCTPISPGCANCYAKRMSKRLAGRCGYLADDPFKVTLHPNKLDEPLKWKKPHRVFVCSMSDLFHPDVPDEWIDQIFWQMGRVARWHTYLILTKRPERMRDWLIKAYNENDPYPNIWIGVTAENQEQADKRIPLLLQTPAAIRFVSVEPMLGPVNFRWASWEPLKPNSRNNQYDGMRRLDWIICGGETGPGARPMQIEWARNLKNQCQEAGVPFFFKKLGGKSTSRFLDGVEYSEYPKED